jgi:hypothetical protein
LESLSRICETMLVVVLTKTMLKNRMENQNFQVLRNRIRFARPVSSLVSSWHFSFLNLQEPKGLDLNSARGKRVQRPQESHVLFRPHKICPWYLSIRERLDEDFHSPRVEALLHLGGSLNVDDVRPFPAIEAAESAFCLLRDQVLLFSEIMVELCPCHINLRTDA